MKKKQEVKKLNELQSSLDDILETDLGTDTFDEKAFADIKRKVLEMNISSELLEKINSAVSQPEKYNALVELAHDIQTGSLQYNIDADTSNVADLLSDPVVALQSAANAKKQEEIRQMLVKKEEEEEEEEAQSQWTDEFGNINVDAGDEEDEDDEGDELEEEDDDDY